MVPTRIAVGLPLRTLVLAAALSAGAAAAWAAAPDGAIDCGKAEKLDEKAICADPRLIQDDARMATLLKIAGAFVGMGTRGEMQDAQVKWLDDRHGCREDVACLREAYAKRIGLLQKIIDTIAARGPF